MNSLSSEIVPVSPKTDLLCKPAELPRNDTPTVADEFPPYATAHDAVVDEGTTSYGELWKAYFYNSGFYPEM